MTSYDSTFKIVGIATLCFFLFYFIGQSTRWRIGSLGTVLCFFLFIVVGGCGITKTYDFVKTDFQEEDRRVRQNIRKDIDTYHIDEIMAGMEDYMELSEDCTDIAWIQSEVTALENETILNR